jgi:hypothetical protein
MDTEQIEQIFKQEDIGSEITCPQAFELSEKYQIPKMDIARYCNVNKIKIRACQLGCFK